MTTASASAKNYPDGTSLLRGEDVNDRVHLVEPYINAFANALAEAIQRNEVDRDRVLGKPISACVQPNGSLFLFAWIDQEEGLIFGTSVPPGFWLYA